jgi:topoisomerase IA-like protein
MLLAKRANIESKDNLGQIPLHKAVTTYTEDNSASKVILKNILKRHAEFKLPINIKDKI